MSMNKEKLKDYFYWGSRNLVRWISHLPMFPVLMIVFFLYWVSYPFRKSTYDGSVEIGWGWEDIL